MQVEMVACPRNQINKLPELTSQELFVSAKTLKKTTSTGQTNLLSSLRCRLSLSKNTAKNKKQLQKLAATAPACTTSSIPGLPYNANSP
jgi:hypothetical protein